MKRKSLKLGIALTAVMLGLVLATACTAKDADKGSAQVDAASAEALEYPVTVEDDAGRAVTIESEPQRIVSLAPANTEVLFELGLGSKVVGVTSYDDYPLEVEGIAKVGDFSGPNIEAVAAADPDLILATTGVQAEVIQQLEDLGATVMAVDPKSLEGLYEDISEIAAATNSAEEGALLVEDMKAQVAEVREVVAAEPEVSVFVEIGQDPLFTVGDETLIGELVALAGGRNVVQESGYVPYSVEQLVKADPDCYLATKGTMSSPDSLESRPGYKDLGAVKSGRVFLLDDNLVTRPGPRIVEGLVSISQSLHPEAWRTK